MKVFDWKDQEIKIGTKVLFGSPETFEERAKQTGEVIAISEPDITSHDDEYGREIVDGYELTIKVRFSDGDTETTRARIVTSYREVEDGAEEVFEECGDLEVLLS